MNSTEEIIHVRDLLDLYEEMEAAREYTPDGEPVDVAGNDELSQLADILDDMRGYSGDERWRGDWYPATLIHESYFTDYVQEMLEDCGTVPRDLPTWVEIDWDATARNVRMDYTSVHIDGVTYWYR